MNIFGLKKKGKYEEEYIWVDKKGRVWILIWLFGLVFANTNTNICQTLVLTAFEVTNMIVDKLLFCLQLGLQLILWFCLWVVVAIPVVVIQQWLWLQQWLWFPPVVVDTTVVVVKKVVILPICLWYKYGFLFKLWLLFLQLVLFLKL